uniref:Uncharacterized protein n=1 Tax=Chromera velia CCMP2878 TaxID=1169474 RepID=A0A0G4GS44_9ALVE|eukprot:Cvel_23132.t1-p1 / transcript=Cvel_23132.t1 / gene=Cvel_23132 / organism=Chromera_velia_CCMP2878 / gene_product=hypothetical protein / transcript_product=hypothetical protein / location=Cvel_scaffold2350:15591-18005(+) / protein_length=351 / sequence_SO=supercontig / SO=protein_coding / is_pseudo=false
MQVERNVCDAFTKVLENLKQNTQQQEASCPPTGGEKDQSCSPLLPLKDEAMPDSAATETPNKLAVETNCVPCIPSEDVDTEAPSDSATEPATPQSQGESPCDEGFGLEQTLLIFDWDDTLLPSSWLAEYQMRLDEDCIVPDALKDQLAELSDRVLRTLEAARTAGTITIVTNAENGWVELSGRKFLPKVCDFVKEHKLRVLSARSTYEPMGFETPLDWKTEAFNAELRRHFSQPGLESVRRNVVSFGDSAHERQAILDVTRKMGGDIVTKSLKFVERPSIDQLRKVGGNLVRCESGWRGGTKRHRGRQTKRDRERRSEEGADREQKFAEGIKSVFASFHSEETTRRRGRRR